MLLADREKLWPKLNDLGEEAVRNKFASNEFESFEEDEVQEWLHRQDMINAVNESKEASRISRSAKNASWAAVLIALISIIFSMYTLFWSKQ